MLKTFGKPRSVPVDSPEFPSGLSRFGWSAGVKFMRFRVAM
jgi:hypothetical protein